jgi:hypothetical protein
VRTFFLRVRRSLVWDWRLSSEFVSYYFN